MARDRTAPFYKETSTYEYDGVQHIRHRAGDMLGYAHKWTMLHRPDLMDWEMKPFEKLMTLKYVGYTRGRSAAGFEWQDVETLNTYPMFMSDFDELARQGRLSGSLDNGTFIVGTFTAVKKGQNFGIKRIG